MAGGQSTQGGPGDSELDTDLEQVDPDEEAQETDDAGDEEVGEDAGDVEGEGQGGDAEGDDAGTQTARGARDVLGRQGAGRQGRYQRLANENRELKGKVDTFERQLQQLVAERRQPSQAEIAAEQAREAEAVALMSPAEVAAYYSQKTERTIRAELQRDRAVLFDRADKNEYDALLRETPAYRRYDEKVEELYRQAPTVPRRILLATAIGMAAMEGKGRATTRATRAADEARGRQTARPTNGRGDVRSDRGRSTAARDDFEHLRNVAI
jgi:hypothetical protein